MLYLADVGTFFGDMPPPSPPNLDEDMVVVAIGQGPQPHIPPDMQRRPDLKYRMEVCDRLSAILVGTGVCPI